jgi:hypothetical protein
MRLIAIMIIFKSFRDLNILEKTSIEIVLFIMMTTLYLILMNKIASEI